MVDPSRGPTRDVDDRQERIAPAASPSYFQRELERIAGAQGDRRRQAQVAPCLLRGAATQGTVRAAFAVPMAVRVEPTLDTSGRQAREHQPDRMAHDHDGRGPRLAWRMSAVMTNARRHGIAGTRLGCACAAAAALLGLGGTPGISADPPAAETKGKIVLEPFNFQGVALDDGKSRTIKPPCCCGAFENLSGTAGFPRLLEALRRERIVRHGQIVHMRRRIGLTNPAFDQALGA